MNRTKDIILIAVVIILLVAPFANKAYHIDDYLLICPARHLAKQPFNHSDVPFVHGGAIYTSWIREATHPPFVPYYIAMVMKLTGSESEVVLHIAFLVFPLLMGISMYSLARRFRVRGLMATLFLIACPGIVVMSHNVMTDIPYAALWLAGLALFIHGVDRERWCILLFSGVLFLFAFFSAYQLLFFVPLPIAYAFLNRKGIRPVLLSVLWPCLVLVGWMVFPLIVNEPSPLTETLIRFLAIKYLYSVWYILERFVSFLANIGSNPGFLICGLALATRRKNWWALFLSILAGIVLTAWFPARPQALGGILFLFLIVFGGVNVLVLFCAECSGWVWHGIRNGFRRLMDTMHADERDEMLLSIWLWGMLVLTVCFLKWGAVRHTLILLPPLVIGLVRRLERTFKRPIALRSVCAAGILASVLVAVLVAAADYEYANSYRSFVRSAKELKDHEQEVWFVADWGLRYYMEQEGFQHLLVGIHELQEGDLIIMPTEAWVHSPFREIRRHARLLQSWDLRARLPLRTLSKKDQIGFYSHRIGILPYGMSDKPLERIEMYAVNAKTISYLKNIVPR